MEREQRLEETLSQIRRRWGQRAICTLATTLPEDTFEAISTGFMTLDDILDGKGIPLGHLSYILGTPTSGSTTLALKVLKNAQSKGSLATYIGYDQTLDIDFALRCGVQPERLLLAIPRAETTPFHIATDIVAKRLPAMIVINLLSDNPTLYRDAELATGLRRLTRLLANSPCAVICLDSRSSDARLQAHITSYATLQINLEWREWIQRDGDVRGYRSHAEIIKHKLRRELTHRHTVITVSFDDVVDGDGV